MDSMRARYSTWHMEMINNSDCACTRPVSRVLSDGLPNWILCECTWVRKHCREVSLKLQSLPEVFRSRSCQRTNSKICFSHRGLDRRKPQRTLNRSEFAQICPGKASFWPYVKQNRPGIKYRREWPELIQHRPTLCLWSHLGPRSPPGPYSPLPRVFNWCLPKGGSHSCSREMVTKVRYSAQFPKKYHVVHKNNNSSHNEKG